MKATAGCAILVLFLSMLVCAQVKNQTIATLRASRSLKATRMAIFFLPFRATLPRIYVDSAPHLAVNSGLTLTNWHGFSGSLRYRHISNYRLDGEDASIRASGLDVLDFSMAKDNLTDKRYFKTQNYFEPRLRPGDSIIARIHATPGYPLVATVGLTFHFFGK